jgi:hypothetical protein
MNMRGIDTEALASRQRFTGKLEQNSFEGRGFHK